MTLRLPFSWTNRRLSRYCHRKVSESCSWKLAFRIDAIAKNKRHRNRIESGTIYLLQLRLCGRHFEKYLFGVRRSVQLHESRAQLSPAKNLALHRAPPPKKMDHVQIRLCNGQSDRQQQRATIHPGKITQNHHEFIRVAAKSSGDKS